MIITTVALASKTTAFITVNKNHTSYARCDFIYGLSEPVSGLVPCFKGGGGPKSNIPMVLLQSHNNIEGFTLVRKKAEFLDKPSKHSTFYRYFSNRNKGLTIK